MITAEKATETTAAVKPVAVTPSPIKAATASAVAKPATTAVVPPAVPKPAVKAVAKRAVKNPVVTAKTSVKSDVPTAVKLATKPKAKPVAKTPAKALPKLAPKATVKAPTKATVSAAQKGKAVKDAKAKKPKLVRDSFTIPKAEYTVLDDLKQRAGKLSSAVKKSELIRAGVKALAAMSDMAFLSALKAVPAIKTGRPSKAKA